MVSVLSNVVGVLREALERLRAWGGFETLPSVGLKFELELGADPCGLERLFVVSIMPVEAAVAASASASAPERFCW